MNPTRRDKIERLIALAPPGPWELAPPSWHKGCSGFDCKQNVCIPGKGTVAVAFGAQYRSHHAEDPPVSVDSPVGLLIAAAPVIIPELLAELDKLEGDNITLNQKVEWGLEIIETNKEARAATKQQIELLQRTVIHLCELLQLSDTIFSDIEDLTHEATRTTIQNTRTLINKLIGTAGRLVP